MNALDGDTSGGPGSCSPGSCRAPEPSSPRPALKRLFVSVRPPPEVRGAIEHLGWPEHPGVRLSAPRQWHVTIVFLGRADPAAVGSALASIELPRCRAVVGPTVRMLGRQVAVVPVAGLDALAAAVRRATTQLGEPQADRPFNGHITVARLKDRQRPELLAELPLGASVSGSWTPQTVELVSSITDPAGAIYRTEGTFGIDVS